MPQVYASSDVCIVCLKPVPFLEKFIPSKIFEIIASGRPVIAALAGEAAEIVREAGHIVVAPGANMALARKYAGLGYRYFPVGSDASYISAGIAHFLKE